MASTRRWLGLVLLVGMVLRVVASFLQPGDLEALPDQVEYWELAQNVRNSGTLSFHDDRFGQEVYAYRTPGYPLFVAIFGRLTPLAQAAVDTSTALAVYLLARKWLTERQSLFAAALVALNPFLIYFSGLILSETLFTALLAWGIYLSSSVSLVTAVMVRPSALLIPLLVPLLNWSSRRPYQRLGWASALLLIAMGLWGWRNHHLLNRWVFTTTNSGITRYDGFHAGATGASDQSFVKSMPELATLNEVQRSEHLDALASEFIREHPGEAALLALKKIARTWSPVPLSKEYGSAKNVILGLVWSVPFYLLVVVGLWRGNLPRQAKLLLLLPAVYFTVVHALSVGSLRYRIPCEPELAILAASAVGKRLQNAVDESR